MIGALLRRTGFWALDVVKGGKAIKHYNNIKDIMEDKCETCKILSKILQHSIDTVPYYKKIKKPVLSAFPIVNKKIYKMDFEAFQSTSYEGQNLHIVSTSGSTGTPFEANQDMDKRCRNVADLIYFHKTRGWEIGEKFIFLRAWTSQYDRSKFKNFKQNVIPLDVIHFGDAEKEQVRELLKKNKRVKVILGYASALELLVNYLIEKGDDPDMFHIKVIFSDSDKLTQTAKKKLENMFGCPVIDRYSNEEQGILACTKPYENIYYINRASYYIELLKLDNDEPAAPGEIGRVVVTDLYNKSMPFIRYDTGDLAISDEVDRANLTIFHSLQGIRADMIFDTNGNSLSAATVNNYLDDFYKVKQYQFVQNEKNEYLLKLNCDSDAYEKSAFEVRLRSFLGDNANIIVEFVNDIPASKTGKYKIIVNNYITQ